MSQTQMYVGATNSPVTTLAESLAIDATSATVVDGTKLPTAPNLLTIGTGEDAETVLMTVKNSNVLTITRAIEGTAKIWDISTQIGRMFTNYDHNAFKNNIEGLRSRGIVFYIDGVLTTSLKVNFVVPCALTVTNVKMSIGTAPTGANLICDVHKNGTTIFTTQANRPTIIATETTEDSSAPDVTSIAAGDLISFQIDQIGSTVAGSDLSATIVCEVA